jgi:hypothetical protein
MKSFFSSALMSFMFSTEANHTSAKTRPKRSRLVTAARSILAKRSFLVVAEWRVSRPASSRPSHASFSTNSKPTGRLRARSASPIW